MNSPRVEELSAFKRLTVPRNTALCRLGQIYTRKRGGTGAIAAELDRGRCGLQGHSQWRRLMLILRC
ncbi:MAG: hypothetical protein ACI89J_000201 [Hyphomicrobiaceae bacterium]|jgi:hypothetical protein